MQSTAALQGGARPSTRTASGMVPGAPGLISSNRHLQRVGRDFRHRPQHGLIDCDA